MKLWVPINWDGEATNWDEELLNRAPKEVEGFYGALPKTPVGAGRPSDIITRAGEKEAASYVKKVHEKGFKFACAMGAPCLGNREYTSEGYKEILEHFEWLCEVGIDYVIVSKPFLCELVKKKFPKLGVITSVIAHVNTVNGLKFWENLGADLEQIVDRANCELELLLNDGCLLNCPYRITDDYPYEGHTALPNAPYKGMGYAIMRCPVDKLSDPVWLLRSPWIRPEDLHEYEKFGIEKFKISGRTETSQRIISAMMMYSKRRSWGNFIDMLLGNPPSLGHFRSTANAIHLDASALDGFLEFSKKANALTIAFHVNGVRSGQRRL